MIFPPTSTAVIFFCPTSIAVIFFFPTSTAVIFPPTSTAVIFFFSDVYCGDFSSNVYCSLYYSDFLFIFFLQAVIFPPMAIFPKFENLFMTVKLVGDSSDILLLDDWWAEGCSDNIEVE